MLLNLDLIKQSLAPHNIDVFHIEEHSKASENYIEVTFRQDDGYEWSGLVPYYYRRTGLAIETEDRLVEYLVLIKPYFKIKEIAIWIEKELEIWNTEYADKTVTKPFFEVLASLKWTNAFPQNPNAQRRIQDIKELGYTISTRRVGRNTERLLVPIPRGQVTGYEVFSAKFRSNALKILSHLNIYELGSANRAGLLPDHKFPEIRWDAETRAENSEEMSEESVKNKFQLLDNQRNQQKREVCRKCFQTGKRGILFGIKYFYEGDEDWASDMPKVGKAAEEGCVGCGWYDIEKWRAELNRLIGE